MNLRAVIYEDFTDGNGWIIECYVRIVPGHFTPPQLARNRGACAPSSP